MFSGGGKKRLTVYLEGEKRLSVNGIVVPEEAVRGKVSVTYDQAFAAVRLLRETASEEEA